MPIYRAVATETITYIIDFHVPEGATEEQIEDAAREEWGMSPRNATDDYEFRLEVQGPISTATK